MGDSIGRDQSSSSSYPPLETNRQPCRAPVTTTELFMGHFLQFHVGFWGGFPLFHTNRRPLELCIPDRRIHLLTAEFNVSKSTRQQTELPRARPLFQSKIGKRSISLDGASTRSNCCSIAPSLQVSSNLLCGTRALCSEHEQALYLLSKTSSHTTPHKGPL